MKILKILLNKRKIIFNQELLIQSLEGIGDILVFETKRQKNKFVLDGLKKISDCIKKFFEIRKNNPEKFERLIMSQDFFDLYNKSKNEAGFRLYFDSEKYLISFSTSINQIVRIHEAAINSQNEEISRFTVIYINQILSHLSSYQDNDFFIKQILKKLVEITKKAIKNQDSSVCTAATQWYTNVIFNRGEKDDFHLSYLSLFDECFFFILKCIISEKQKITFKSLVASLVDGIHIPDYDSGKIWDYGYILLHGDFQKYQKLNIEHNLQNRVTELADSENHLKTQKDLEVWLKRFDDLKSIIEPNLNEKQKNLHKKWKGE